MELTHLDETGAARMVDVGEKAVTRRTACAQSVITMKPETLRMICEDRAPKGDVFACARIAGIMAAKKTSELIPMCHPIPIARQMSSRPRMPAKRSARPTRTIQRTTRWPRLRSL